MHVEGHLGRLQEKHAGLEKAIEEENHRPVPDSVRLTELKRQKLKLKEEIDTFSHAH